MLEEEGLVQDRWCWWTCPPSVRLILCAPRPVCCGWWPRTQLPVPPCEELTKPQSSGSGSWPEADEVLLEYFTAEEPEMHAEAPSPAQSNVSPEVVQQLQARIAQLESQQAAPSGGLAPVVDLEPRPHAAGRSVLFAPGTVSEALADENPAAQQAFAHAEAEVEAGEEVSQVLNASSDPLHQLLALQMKQTAALMQKLAPPTRDPVFAALGSEGGSSQSGVKGCVARDAYLRTMEDVKGTGRSIASNAAVDLGLPADQVNSCLMRSYVEKRMPLGDQRQLTYLGSVHGRGLADELRSKERVLNGLVCTGFDDGGADRVGPGPMSIRLAPSCHAGPQFANNHYESPPHRADSLCQARLGSAGRGQHSLPEGFGLSGGQTEEHQVRRQTVQGRPCRRRRSRRSSQTLEAKERPWQGEGRDERFCSPVMKPETEVRSDWFFLVAFLWSCWIGW